MYSPDVIERNRVRAEQAIRARHDLSSRWTLTPPTDGQRHEMRAHLASLLDDKGAVTRDLTREERLWVLCEWTLCKIDFLYYATHYVKIVDLYGRTTYFTPNKAQQVVLGLMAELERDGMALWMMFLKARQLGITTLFQILMSQRVFFYRDVGCYTGSAEQDKSREMVGKLEFIWDNLDWFLRPRRTAYRAGELMKYGDLNSSVHVQWGNQKGGIGRGATPVVAHLSELSTFLEPAKLVNAALVKAMHENPFSMLTLESTANGLGDWWHKTWQYNSRMEARGLARFKPVFLPWYVGDDLYPTAWEYRRRPAPEGWVPPEYVERHAEAAQTYVGGNALLERYLGRGWTMPLAQKWYYYLNYEEARELRELHIFLQEVPASADEAFQNSNPSVFDLETLNECRTVANGSRPSGVYQIAGQSISPIYSDARVEGTPLIAKAYSEAGDVLDTFELQPIRYEWPETDNDLKLYIWEWPQEGEMYGIYCDPSEGVGEDASVVGVIKRATPYHPDEQVAEWASNKVAPHDLWAYIYCLAHLYTVKGPSGWLEPLVVIETNIAAGDAAQTEMMKRGYGNFHQELDLTMFGETGTVGNRKFKGAMPRVGWRTTTKSRPRMLSLFRKATRDRTFVPRSPALVSEMGTLEYNLDRQRIEASEGRHDDRVMGPAMLLCSWYDPERQGTTPSAFIEQKAYEAQIQRVPIYTGDKEYGKSSRPVAVTGGLWDSRSMQW